MATLEAIISEANHIPAHLPNTLALKDAVKRAKEWNAKVEAVQVSCQNFKIKWRLCNTIFFFSKRGIIIVYRNLFVHPANFQ